MRKIANFFIAKTGETPIVGQYAQARMAGVVLWTDELQEQLEKGTLSSKFIGVKPVSFVFGLRYTILTEGDEVYIPSTNTFAVAVSEKNKSEYIVMVGEKEEIVLRKDIYKVLSKSVSEKQLRPILEGRLCHYNKVVVDFPNIKTVENENFTVSIFVDNDKMDEVKITGDKEADKQAIALTCNKYADPNIDENGFLLIARYKKPKKTVVE